MDVDVGITLNCECESDFRFRQWKYQPALSDALSESSSEFLFSEAVDILMDPEVVFTGTRLDIEESKKMPLSSRQVSILSTLLPDFFLNYSDIIHKIYDTFLCVLFLVDLSGFTLLSETYRKLGASGIYRLTATLNMVFGKLVASIYMHGGDVYKFSGDAFLAVWRLNQNAHPSLILHQALRCALFIQDNYGTFETDVNVLLKMKITLAVGNVIFSTVGNDYARRLLIVGGALVDLNIAQNYCDPGDIVITESAWTLLSPCDFIYELCSDEKYVKIIKQIRYMGVAVPQQIKRLKGALEPSTLTAEEYTLLKELGRKVPDLSIRASQTPVLRLFQIPPVIQQIDADMPLDFLTQMRELTIMFVNVIPMKVLNAEMLNIVDQAFSLIYDIVWEAGGFVDNVSFFDKDVMFVIIFGFHGFHHEQNEVSSCLLSGYDIRDFCHSIQGVVDVSVAVTSGVTYCGVVGHPLRQSFTVIGPVVNKAARLMTAYCGLVSCDTATYEKAIKERMSKSAFTELPPKKLKGIASTEIFYEFTAQKKRILTEQIKSGMYPLIGRSKEIETFLKQLKELGNPTAVENGIMVEGEATSGKSRLLDEMAIECFKNEHFPTILSLRPPHGRAAFASAQYIISEILEIDSSTSSTKMREKEVLSILESVLQPDDFSLIHILMCCSKYSDVTFSRDDAIPTRMKKLFNFILQLGTASTILIIDDVDYCDYATWELLMYAVEYQVKLFVFSRQDGKTFNVGKTYREVPRTVARRLHLIILEGLSATELGCLSCQLLEAEAVHSEAEKFLDSRAKGIPGWCLKILNYLTESEFIIIGQLSRKDLEEDEYVVPHSDCLTKISIDVPSYNMRKLPLDEEIKVAVDCNFTYLDHLNSLHFIKRKYEDWLKEISQSSELGILVPHEARERAASEDIEESDDNDGSVILSEDLSSSHKPILQDIFNLQQSFLGQEKAVPLRFIVSITDLQIEEALEMFLELKDKKTRLPVSSTSEAARRKSTFGGIRTVPSADDMSTTDRRLGVPPSKVASTATRNESQAYILSKVLYGPQTSVDVVRTIIIMKPLELAETQENYISIMGIFDSLRPFDQYLLKSASTIGSRFSRDVLLAVMQNPNENFLNLGIKRMFDANIIKCASASATGTTTLKKVCACLKPDVTTFEAIVPPYALCRDMGFTNAGLKNTLYNVLTPQQRTDMHIRIVEYLESRPFICSHCQEIKVLREKEDSKQALNAIKEDPFLKVESLPDLRECKCDHVQRKLLEDLINHTLLGSKYGKNLFYILQKSKLHLWLSDEESARSCIETAEQLLDDNDNGKINLGLSVVNLSIYRGRIECLLGTICFEAREYVEAKDHIFRAFELFDLYFNKHIPIFESMMPLTKVRFKHSKSYNFFSQSLSDEVIQDAGRAACVLTNIFMMAGKWNQALSVCLMSIDLFWSKMEFAEDLAVAYSNMIDICLVKNETNVAQRFLPHITKKCRYLHLHNTVTAAAALGRMYCSIFYLGIRTNSLKFSLSPNYLEAFLTLTRKLPGMAHTQVHLLADYALTQTLTGQINPATISIRSLQGVSGSAKVWYYVLCLNFLLDTGLQIERASVIIDQLEADIRLKSRSKRRAVNAGKVLIWVWLLRHKEFQEAEKYILIENFNLNEVLVDMLTFISATVDLKILEGLILYTASMAPSLPRTKLARTLIAKMFKKFNKYRGSILSTILVRWKIYKGLYYHLVLNETEKGVTLLNVAEKMARKNNLDLLLHWILLNKEYWSRKQTFTTRQKRNYLDDYPKAEEWTGPESWSSYMHLFE